MKPPSAATAESVEARTSASPLEETDSRVAVSYWVTAFPAGVVTFHRADGGDSHIRGDRGAGGSDAEFQRVSVKVMNRNRIGLGDNGLAAVPTGGGLIIR